MESPTNYGGSEGEQYSSCESGWTMYIEDAFDGNDHSSIVVNEDDDGDIDDDSQIKDAADNGDNRDDGGDDEGSDDSMASDASSGPSNQLPKNIKKHATRKIGSKQVYLQKHQHAEKTLSNEGEKSELKARTRTSAASRVQSKGKASKTK